MYRGEFENSEEFIFHLFTKCDSDLDCNDGNPSITDECLSLVSIYLYCHKEYDKYGQMVFVDFAFR